MNRYKQMKGMNVYYCGDLLGTVDKLTRNDYVMVLSYYDINGGYHQTCIDREEFKFYTLEENGEEYKGDYYVKYNTTRTRLY